MKKRKRFSAINPNYTAAFAARFFGISLLCFAFLGGMLYLALNRRLGIGYTEDISTLSELREKLPVILIVTGMIQIVVFSVILLLMALFWVHNVSGPVMRFRKWLERFKRRNTIENVQFRKTDELHGLAASFSDMQEIHQRRKTRLGEDLKVAAAVLAECERRFEEEKAPAAELASEAKSLRKIYQDAKGRLYGKKTL